MAYKNAAYISCVLPPSLLNFLDPLRKPIYLLSKSIGFLKSSFSLKLELTRACSNLTMRTIIYSST